MTKGWNKYKKEVKASLKCDRKLRRNLLSQLEDFKDSSGVEDGAYDQFAISFGPPQEMASSLMESVSVKEIRKFHAYLRSACSIHKNRLAASAAGRCIHSPVFPSHSPFLRNRHSVFVITAPGVIGAGGDALVSAPVLAQP